MISYHQLIPVINHLILEPLSIGSLVFDPPHLCDPNSIKPSFYHFDHLLGRTIWYHEEPLDQNILQNLIPCVDMDHVSETIYSSGIHSKFNDVNMTILANSEKSELKRIWIKENQKHILDWYFFFHGFLTLDWYRDYKFYNFDIKRSSKLFSSFNHIITEKRSYRLYFIAKLAKENLLPYGHVSCPNLSQSLVKSEIVNKNSWLDKLSKKTIYNNLLPIAYPMILDQVNYNKSSANISSYLHDSYWNIVTETVFYDKKLHLTEKIFKPIASKRPFILIAAPGNLQYLKSYGFQTFDKWINEDYDTIEDPTARIDHVVKQITKLSEMSESKKRIMYNDINQICEYNHYHFFKNFPKIIVNELVDNFEICLKQYNVARYTQRHKFQLDVNFKEIKDKFLKLL